MYQIFGWKTLQEGTPCWILTRTRQFFILTARNIFEYIQIINQTYWFVRNCEKPRRPLVGTRVGLGAVRRPVVLALASYSSGFNTFHILWEVVNHAPNPQPGGPVSIFVTPRDRLSRCASSHWVTSGGPLRQHNNCEPLKGCMCKHGLVSSDLW
jgi:hypothetical protein